MKKLASGCGCLVFICFAVLVVAIVINGPPKSEPPRVQTAEEIEQDKKEKTEREAAQKAESVRKLNAAKANLQRFMDVINKAEINGIVSGIESDGDEKRVKIKVRDSWHISAYQIRLQSAQNLWEIWAKIASPQELDLARINIVDQNGNSVGGSRILAGSLIWVSEK